MVDRLADVIVLQRYEGQCDLTDSALREIAQYFLSRTKGKSAYLKYFVADRTKQVAHDGMYAAEPFLGEPCGSKIICRENGVQFELHPYDGFSYGLFFDQRQNRKFLANLCREKEAFNGFSYTCGFSVFLAREGAKVTSVDLSKNYLDWGKQNFLVNGLSLDGHRFIAEDVFLFLKKQVKRGLRYEVILLDPPSFSRNKKTGTFSLKQDIAELISLAESALSPEGLLFFSCNYAGWDSIQLKRIARKIFSRKSKWLDLPEIPLDFKRQTHTLSAFLVRL